MWVLAARFDLHVGAAESLKDRRRALRPLIDGLRARFNAGVSEVGEQNLWQRAGVGVALCGSDPDVLAQALGKIERFVVSRPELEVLAIDQSVFQTDDR